MTRNTTPPEPGVFWKISEDDRSRRFRAEHAEPAKHFAAGIARRAIPAAKCFAGSACSARNLRDRSSSEIFQKTPGSGGVVFRVIRENDQEESVLGGKRKTRHVKHRVIGHGQP